MISCKKCKYKHLCAEFNKVINTHKKVKPKDMRIVFKLMAQDCERQVKGENL